MADERKGSNNTRSLEKDHFLLSPTQEELFSRVTAGSIEAYRHLYQGGDAAQEQLMVASIAEFLRDARRKQQIPRHVIADELEVLEDDFKLMEHGLIPSSIFFKRLDRWAQMLGYKAENLLHTLQEVDDILWETGRK